MWDTLQLNWDSEFTFVLHVTDCLGKKLVAFKMLINFGVGDIGSNQIIYGYPTSYFPRALILEI